MVKINKNNNMITNPYKEKYYNINQNNAYQMKIFNFYNV